MTEQSQAALAALQRVVEEQDARTDRLRRLDAFERRIRRI